MFPDSIRAHGDSESPSVIALDTPQEEQLPTLQFPVMKETED